MTAFTRHASATGLIALRAPSPLPAAGDMPTRLVILRWGPNETAIGTKTVGMKTLQASQLWQGMGFGEVCIDFNHNTVPAHESYRGEPAKIAAMATPRVIVGEGLVFENIRWTPEGIASRGHYPDLSPAVKDDDSGEVVFVHSAALARNGAVNGLHLFASAAIPAGVQSLMGSSKAAGQGGSIRELCIELFDLPEDATVR